MKTGMNMTMMVLSNKRILIKVYKKGLEIFPSSFFSELINIVKFSTEVFKAFIALFFHDFFQFFSNSVKDSHTFFLKCSTNLDHTCTTKDMFKSITPRFDTTSTDDLDFRFQTLVESMNVCLGSRFDIVSTDTAKTIFRFDDNRFVFNIKSITN